MVFDGNVAFTFAVWQQWFERKTIEFNHLHPSISVTPIYLNYWEMLSEAQQDVESRMNRFHAYVIPYMNTRGATSTLADHLMDMSTFTVDNVNDIGWHTIGRYFRAYSSLFEGKVLTLPVAGDFFSFCITEKISSRSLGLRYHAHWRSTCSLPKP